MESPQFLAMEAHDGREVAHTQPLKLMVVVALVMEAGVVIQSFEPSQVTDPPIWPVPH